MYTVCAGIIHDRENETRAALVAREAIPGLSFLSASTCVTLAPYQSFTRVRTPAFYPCMGVLYGTCAVV